MEFLPFISADRESMPRLGYHTPIVEGMRDGEND